MSYFPWRDVVGGAPNKSKEIDSGNKKGRRTGEPLFTMYYLTAAISLPPQFSNMVSYGLMIVFAAVTVNSLVQVGLGFKAWSRGDDAFGKIKFGLLLFGIPWLVQAVFSGLGFWSKLGISLVPTGLSLPAELVDAVQFGLWIIICLFAGLAIHSGIEGVQKMDRGEDGKRQVWGAIAMAASPALVIGAAKLGGYWDAFGLKLI